MEFKNLQNVKMGKNIEQFFGTDCKISNVRISIPELVKVFTMRCSSSKRGSCEKRNKIIKVFI